MSTHLFRKGLLALVLLGAATSFAAAQTLEQVKQRGTLIVGVKADYKPFGFRDPSGKIVGFGPDLAKLVADTIGVKLQLVPVVASNRMQFLQQGKIDLMIATMNDTKERRKVVGIVLPDYYASGVNVLAAKSANLKQWNDLKGKKICAIQGSWYNKTVAEKYGAQIVAFKGVTEAENALLQGNCIGFLYDNTAFAGPLSDTKTWGKYEMPLPTILESPMGMAVRHDELDKVFGRFMSGMIYTWHRTGKLIEIEKKWHIPSSKWLAKMHEKYSADSEPPNY
ncbi:MAG TPA: transporter substrate-binding domain-containing protein [Pseudolabrys sp.]|jgi:polar amino acid transport system substrate-binding protein|nr:transporter substrate-binding domain-containing protein [Pseudolabrys sp.]